MDNFSIFSIQYVLSFIIFCVSIYCSWYLPGRFFLKDNEKNPVTQILFATVIGIALWGVQGYIFGYLHVRILTYVYCLFFLAYFWKSHKVFLSNLYKTIKDSVYKNKLLTVLIAVGVVLQLLPVAGSGVLYKDGVHFSGVNAYDGVMHLAFITSIEKQFPPVQPGAFDHAMTNYHYWSDLIISDLVRVWYLPSSHVFFQFIPVLISVLTGVASYKVVRAFGFSKIAGIWSLFFVYFGADATYLLIYVAYRILNFTTPAIDNGVTQFLNMPHALAKLIFLTSLMSLHNWFTTKKIYHGILIVLLFSVLVGIKVYFGIFAIFGFGLVIIQILISRFFTEVKKDSVVKSFKNTFVVEKQSLLLISGLLVSAALIFLPPNKSSGGLGYYPLEWAKIFLGPGVLNWGDWWLRHQVYDAHNNMRGIIFLDTIAVIVTLICVHGTRLIGLIPSKNVYKKLGSQKLLFFVPGVLIFHFLALFTLQKSGGLNVFNFFVVTTVVLSLFSGMVLENIGFHKRSIGVWVLTALIIVLTIPRIFYETYAYTQKYHSLADDTQVISQDELDAFTFLRNKTDKNVIVQSHPSNPYDRQTPYVSYFSKRLAYLSGVGMQESHNQPLADKKKMLDTLFFKTDHPQTFSTNALRMGINYIYIRKVAEEKLLFPIDTNLIKPVFENKSVVIYKLQL